MQVSKYFELEDTPMTMQVAIQAKDGFVLASDTRNRITGTPVSSLMQHSKICYNDSFQIAIAMMGRTEDPNANPAGSLASLLNQASTVDVKTAAMQWAREYTKNNAVDCFSLLLLHPAASHNRMWKLEIRGDQIIDHPSLLWFAFHGNENSPAIFWTEFFRCKGKHQLSEATNIAALTVLMGGELNPYGVQGLEVTQYISKWEPLAPEVLEKIITKHEKLKAYLSRFASRG